MLRSWWHVVDAWRRRFRLVLCGKRRTVVAVLSHMLTVVHRVHVGWLGMIHGRIHWRRFHAVVHAVVRVSIGLVHWPVRTIAVYRRLARHLSAIVAVVAMVIVLVELRRRRERRVVV